MRSGYRVVNWLQKIGATHSPSNSMKLPPPPSSVRSTPYTGTMPEAISPGSPNAYGLNCQRPPGRMVYS